MQGDWQYRSMMTVTGSHQAGMKLAGTVCWGCVSARFALGGQFDLQGAPGKGVRASVFLPWSAYETHGDAGR